MPILPVGSWRRSVSLEVEELKKRLEELSKLRNKIRYEINRDYDLERMKKRRFGNDREEVLEYYRDWHSKNKEKVNDRVRKYRNDNPDKIREQRRQSSKRCRERRKRQKERAVSKGQPLFCIKNETGRSVIHK